MSADDDADGDGRRPIRASAHELYERVKAEAAAELDRPLPGLAFSGLFSGASVGFGVAASAAAAASLGDGHGARLIGDLFFPIGFIIVVIGRAQLFTENTLYPVTLVLDERRHLQATLRLWAVVLAANLIGAALFALLVTHTGALSAHAVADLADDGRLAVHGTWASFFWSAVLGGWLVALVAWLIQSGAAVIGQIALIYALTVAVAVLRLDHCVSTTVEVLSGVFDGDVALPHALEWFSAVLLGNVVGGVLITALLNYGQVRAGED